MLSDLKKKRILIAFAIILLLGFILASLWLIRIPFGGSAQKGIQLLADQLQDPDKAPTPFQPYQYTATPTRNVQPVQNALVPNQNLLPPEGQVNILVLGSDWRPGGGFRTDVVLLVSIYTKESKIALVSFPRDLWVEIPGLEQNRINTAMGYGGFPLVSQTLEHNFAIRIDHYMMTNFNGFKNIVDSLGGVDIYASKNTADRCDLSYQHGGWCSVGPGERTMDGEVALWYVRSRYTSNDFDRTRRAQEVLLGLFKKLMSLDGIAKAPEIYNQFISSVETDLNLNDVLSFVNIAPAILSDPSRIERYAIGPEHVTGHIIPSTGANVLLPNYDAIWQVIQEAVYTP